MNLNPNIWHILKLLSLPFILTGMAQAAEFDLQETLTFGGEANEEGQSVSLTDDGGLVLAATTSSTQFGDKDILLVKLDAQRQVQWQVHLGDAANNTVAKVIQTDDGGFAVAGYSDVGSVLTRNALVIKVDAQGQQQWQSIQGGNQEDSFEGICQTRDGGYAVVGATSSMGEGGHAHYMVKLDDEGQLEWERATGGGADYLTGVVEDAEGNLLACGYHKAGSSFTPPYDAILMKRSATGALIFERTYNFSSVDRAYGLGLLPGGDVLITGEVGYGCGLWRVTGGGSLVWGTTWNTNSGSIHGRDVWDNGDGSIVVVGTHSNMIFVAKASTEGQKLFSGEFGGEGNDWGRGVCRTADGQYAVMGSSSSFEGAGGLDMLLLVLEGPAALSPVKPGPARGGRAQIRNAYPNPFNPSTRISFSVAQDGPAQLEILDARGRRVSTLFEGSLTAGEHERTWNGRDSAGRVVPAGLYFARVRAQGQQDVQKLSLIK